MKALLFQLVEKKAITSLDQECTRGVAVVEWGVAVVEWLRSRPLDCDVRGSNQGRNLKTKISASGALRRW